MGKNVFEANPTAEELLSFPDGTCFLNDKNGLNNAINYEKKTGTKFKVVKKEAAKKEDNNNKNDKK